jgi:hypothetical protein
VALATTAALTGHGPGRRVSALDEFRNAFTCLIGRGVEITDLLQVTAEDFQVADRDITMAKRPRDLVGMGSSLISSGP